ncbi:MAG: hypothetical protein M1426_02105 [Patescibacteria group bacterium]|nr:hypothetical protein [Patescibacteria group bacterium]
MKNLKEQTNNLLAYFKFKESSISFDEEGKKVLITIRDEAVTQKQVPMLLDSFDKILKLIAKKYDEGPITVDLNNYHADKEKMIIELARAAAKKASVTRSDVALPPMNSYERRLVHNSGSRY